MLVMNLEWMLQLAPSVATVAAAAFGLGWSEGKLRRHLKSDADLAAVLPDGSEAKKLLMSHIEAQIARLQRSEIDGRHDWFGFTLGLCFALVGGYGALWLFKHPEWWRWFGLIAVVVAILGLVGIADGLEIKEREVKGRRGAVGVGKPEKSPAAEGEAKPTSGGERT
jgi:hypothetical protein